MKVPKTRQASSKRTAPPPFQGLPPGLSHALFWRVTLVSAGAAALLSALGFLINQELSDRKIAGTQRVLDSLSAESSALEQQWQAGQLPAMVLDVEGQNIAEEASQASEQLGQLESSSNG
jgi:hypothetical protein